MHNDFEEAQKRHLADTVPDIGYEDIEGLPIEDVRAILHRRHDHVVEETREIQAAIVALSTALESLSGEERRAAARGIARLIGEGDSNAATFFIEDGMEGDAR